jgi:hypothetical protein
MALEVTEPFSLVFYYFLKSSNASESCESGQRINFLSNCGIADYRSMNKNGLTGYKFLIHKTNESFYYRYVMYIALRILLFHFLQCTLFPHYHKVHDLSVYVARPSRRQTGGMCRIRIPHQHCQSRLGHRCYSH